MVEEGVTSAERSAGVIAAPLDRRWWALPPTTLLPAEPPEGMTKYCCCCCCKWCSLSSACDSIVVVELFESKPVRFRGATDAPEPATAGPAALPLLVAPSDGRDSAERAVSEPAAAPVAESCRDCLRGAGVLDEARGRVNAPAVVAALPTLLNWLPSPAAAAAALPAAASAAA